MMETKQPTEKVVIINYKVHQELQLNYDLLNLDYQLLRDDYFKLLDDYNNLKGNDKDLI